MRRPGEIVVVACDQAAVLGPADLAAQGAVPCHVSCAGNLHTSVIEALLRGGCGGVLVLTCPPRDCNSREGPRWLSERLYHGREAELQERVDRRRIRVAHAAAGERVLALRALAGFAKDVAALGMPAELETSAPDVVCEPAPLEARRVRRA